MRVAWVAPLVRFVLLNDFVIPPDAQYSAWLVLAVLLTASLTGRLARRHRRGAHISVAAGIVVVFVVLVYSLGLNPFRLGGWLSGFLEEDGSFRIGMPAAVIIVVVTAALWWRGMTASWHDYAQLFAGFMVGVVALGAMMLLGSQDAWQSRGLDPWVAGVGFVFSALVALALIATYEILSWERFSGQGGPGFSSHWLIVVGALVASIVGLGWAASRMTRGDISRAVATLMAPIWTVLRAALEYVLLAWGYLVFEMLGGLVTAIQVRLAARWGILVGLLRRFAGDAPEQAEEALRTSSAAESGLRIGFYAVLAITIVTLFYIAFRKVRRNEPSGVQEKRDYIWSRALILEQLRSLFRGLRKRHQVAPLLPLDESEGARRAIRERYRQFLAAMSTRGRERPPSVTPREYERLVASLLRHEREALRVLTEAYLVARYAPEPPTPKQVREALSAYARIEQELGVG